jgi:two-component system catabolic regulation response regulator CreB
MTYGPFTVDRRSKTIRYHGTTLELSRYEYRLLEVLLGHPGRVFSRRELMEAVWDEPEVSLERTVDTHVKTIRTKLRDIAADEDPVETKRGFGYSLRKMS